MSSPLRTISLAQYKSLGLNHAIAYRDRIILSDRLEYLDRLHYPCRIDAATIVICLGGSAEASINLCPYEVHAGSILVCFADDVLQVHSFAGLEAYVVMLANDYLDELQLDFRSRSAFFLGIHRNAVATIPREEIHDLRHYRDLLRREITEPRSQSPHIINGLVHALCYTVISLVNLHRNTESPPPAEHTRGTEVFNQFMAELNQHYTRERSVDFYASRLCLTPNYFSGLIKRVSGRNAREWICDYLILECKVLLRTTSLSIQEISNCLNFSTQSAFGKFFKEQVGVGPKAYRRGQTRDQTVTSR